jgi:outer membrane protein TolC
MPAAAREKKAVDLPLEERIRRRAYELYVQRGGVGASAVDDWLQAEEELLAEQDRILEEEGE